MRRMHTDMINNKELTGDEAYKELEEIFKNFKFDQDAADEDVLNEVRAFSLKEDYQKMELEIKFADGTE